MYAKLVFVTMFLVLLVGCSPAPETVAFLGPEQQAAIQSSSAVQIPEALVQILNAALIALFTAGFVYLFELTGIDFRQSAIPLATALGSWVVIELQGYINMVPEINDYYINLIFRVLLALIPAAGVLRIFSKQARTLLEHSAHRLR